MLSRGKRLVELALKRNTDNDPDKTLTKDENNNESDDHDIDISDYDDDVKDPTFFPSKRRRDSSSDDTDIEQNFENNSALKSTSISSHIQTKVNQSIYPCNSQTDFPGPSTDYVDLFCNEELTSDSDDSISVIANGQNNYGVSYDSAVALQSERNEPDVEDLIVDHEEVITEKESDKEHLRQQIEKSTKITKLKNKRLRMTGLKYKGVVRDEDGKKHFSKDRTERSLYESKCSAKCRKKVGGRRCFEMEEKLRETIFEQFWRKMDWNQKRVYVMSLVDKCEAKKATEDGRKSITHKYHLKLDEERIQVCREMFLSTLGLHEKMVYQWLKGAEVGVPKESRLNCVDGQQTKPKRNGSTAALEQARQYLTELPKLPSHYCRSSTTKQYLEPLFINIMDVYKEYNRKMLEKNEPVVQTTQFYKVFHDMNLSLYRPKKDLCDTCCGYKAKTVSQNDYEKHIKRKEEARASKESDKERTRYEKNVKVITVDLQSLLTCPKLNASCLYYKMKLSCHNYTIFDLASRQVMCYFWHECHGELTANIFTTCLLDYLSNIDFQEINHVIVYSDGCGYQNRNITLSNALLNFSTEKNITIEQKFLERGHTQMECDSVHSVIERHLKNRPIYVPQQYVDGIKDARKIVPYEIKYVDYRFFKDFSNIGKYSSIRPGIGVGTETVNDIRCLRYGDGVIRFKTTMSAEYQDLPTPRKVSGDKNTTTTTQLYNKEIPLKRNKFLHLQQLKSVIPKDYHAFYDKLPHHS